MSTTTPLHRFAPACTPTYSYTHATHQIDRECRQCNRLAMQQQHAKDSTRAAIEYIYTNGYLYTHARTYIYSVYVMNIKIKTFFFRGRYIRNSIGSCTNTHTHLYARARTHYTFTDTERDAPSLKKDLCQLVMITSTCAGEYALHTQPHAFNHFPRCLNGIPILLYPTTRVPYISTFFSFFFPIGKKYF